MTTNNKQLMKNKLKKFNMKTKSTECAKLKFKIAKQKLIQNLI